MTQLLILRSPLILALIIIIIVLNCANASATNATNASATNGTNASATNATATNATNASATGPNLKYLSVGPKEVSEGGSIIIELPLENREPAGANWTYELESLPSHGSVPIKKGGYIPNGIIPYQAFPNFTGNDYFTYNVTHKFNNQQSSTTGSISITSYVPKPIIYNPILRLITSFVITTVLIIVIIIAALRIITKLRKNKSPINSSKFSDIIRSNDMDPSLSVFQFFLWTIVLMFVLFSVYLIRIFGGVTEAISGPPPIALLALTGISIVTPFGSSLISSLGYPKADKTETNASATNVSATNVSATNVSAINTNQNSRPPWGDMLREFGKPSLSRFQMFGWTWISIAIYLSVYGAEISRDYSTVGFLNIPDVYPLLVVLMGLSQVVFLGAKANVTNQIEITKVFPLEVKEGEQLSVFGLNFGNDRQDVWLGTHRIGSADKEHLLGWSDGRIDIMIPDLPDQKDGYEIMIAKGGSSKIAFKGDGMPIKIKILQKDEN